MSHTKISRALVSLATLGLGVTLGCERREPPRESPPVSSTTRAAAATVEARKPAAPIPHASPPTREAMRDHFKAVGLVRDALIAGNLDLAKWIASWLAEREPNPALQGWSLYVDHLRERAAMVVAAKTFDDAARATANLGAECGNCHAANHASPTFPFVDQRVPASGARPHMLRHQWAAEQMWIGLVAPSEKRWNAGAAELAEAPLAQENILPNASVTPELATLATNVHAIGAEGARATTWNERTAIYGRLLTTCATCHSMLPRTDR